MNDHDPNDAPARFDQSGTAQLWHRGRAAAQSKQPPATQFRSAAEREAYTAGYQSVARDQGRLLRSLLASRAHGLIHKRG